MSIRLLHTADWQTGKPFHSIENKDSRASFRKTRLDVIDKMRELFTAKELQFVLIADLITRLVLNGNGLVINFPLK